MAHTANHSIRMARNRYLDQPAPLDFGHADGRLITPLPSTPPIRFDATGSHNGCEIADMGDMVDFRLGRWCCHAILTYPNRWLLTSSLSTRVAPASSGRSSSRRLAM